MQNTSFNINQKTPYHSFNNLDTKKQTPTINIDSETNLISGYQDKLPIDMLKYIFGYLEKSDLINVSLTCKRWQVCANDKRLWAFHFLKKYGFECQKDLVKQDYVERKKVLENISQQKHLFSNIYFTEHNWSEIKSWNINQHYIAIFKELTNGMNLVVIDLETGKDLYQKNLIPMNAILENLIQKDLYSHYSLSIEKTFCIDFINNQWLLLSGQKQQSLWDLNTGECLLADILSDNKKSEWLIFDNYLICYNLKSDSTSSTYKPEIEIWDINQKHRLNRIELEQPFLFDVNIAFYDRHLLIFSKNSVTTYDIISGKKVYQLNDTIENFKILDSNRFVYEDQKKIHIHCLKTGKLITTLPYTLTLKESSPFTFFKKVNIDPK